MDFHFPLAGLIVLLGSVAFLKFFDYLAARSAKRLIEMAGGGKNG
jgi:hypothetical protein